MFGTQPGAAAVLSEQDQALAGGTHRPVVAEPSGPRERKEARRRQLSRPQAELP